VGEGGYRFRAFTSERRKGEEGEHGNTFLAGRSRMIIQKETIGRDFTGGGMDPGLANTTNKLFKK